MRYTGSTRIEGSNPSRSANVMSQDMNLLCQARRRTVAALGAPGGLVGAKASIDLVQDPAAESADGFCPAP